ncbi:MAG: bifunctional diaminohydroxyphosphoribosylaminopyrimidine deaminase/5-amino-6-(5-phosphoribosylamino)uracil reductase RibD [Chloroflexi bacterium]|nr:bifunctional diaminohydroxyphosphoribosylaminopyrimidine deaminase/5-amino-6-(5-phosphoribosylamino)uracil reductase RibD [Chloroflexota bacterium]
MARALDMARRARGRTHPNPPVGAVVVGDDGTVLGEGATQPAGGDHAEVMALRAAGSHARGATLVVTLEPCNHYGHTPPCTEAILRSGISRVVAAIPDTNPGVRGGGFDYLRGQGVQVVTGVGARAASDLAQGHFKLTETGRPHVSAKWAVTADGKVAQPSGGGRITGDAAWRRVHAMRDAADAIITGVDSILVDDSRLTVRPPPVDGRQPLRVVLDSQARTPPSSRVVGHDGRSLILTTAAAPFQRVGQLNKAGAEVLICPHTAAGRVDINAALQTLGALRLSTVLLEAGPTLTGAFLAAGAVDSLAVFVAPWTMGDGLSAPAAVETLLACPRVSSVGEDTVIEGDLQRYGPAVN